MTPPSGDALDRAQELANRYGERPTAGFLSAIATLIDRADETAESEEAPAADVKLTLGEQVTVLERKLEIADRQRREFKRHQETTAARLRDAETERDAALEMLRVAKAERDVARIDRAREAAHSLELQAQLRSTERRVEAGAEGLTARQLLAELERRLAEPRAGKDSAIDLD